jgi:TRAP transporter TAXI family solute receptor
MEKRKTVTISSWRKTCEIILLGSLICCFVLFSFSSAFAQKKRISIGGASQGGVFYVMAVGMAQAINRHLPDYNAIALETGGAMENLRLVSKGEIEIATANARDATLGYTGQKPFTTPLKNLRLGIFIGNFILHIVTLEKSNIRKVEDLKGKVVNVGPPGSIVASTMEALLRLHNVSIKDVKLRHLGYSEASEAVADGIIDASAMYGTIPSSAVTSLAATKKIRLVSADEKILEAAAAKENIVPFFVPPESYKGQSEGAYVWAVIAATYYNESTSVDDVYKWTKAILENKSDIEKVHPQGKEVRLVTKKELAASPIPLHPGVLKYAKEVGVTY